MPNRAHILVVDDDPLFRNLIASFLRDDFLVSVAADGSEGFYKALEQPPAVAIVDVRMPNWDGLKTLDAFRSHPALNRVKVMILTNDASRQTVLAAIRGGAADYVIKSAFNPEDFLHKLARLLPGDAAPRPVTDERAGPRHERGRTAPIQRAAAPVAASVETSASEPYLDEASRLQAILDDWE